MKKIINYKTVTIMLILLAIILYYFTSDRYSIDKMYSNFNNNRATEINIIENKIKLYYVKNNTFPKAIGFKGLQEYFPSFSNDIKYHYSYMSDGDNYLLTYPFESYEGNACEKKSNNISAYKEEEIHIKCNETLSRKRQGE